MKFSNFSTMFAAIWQVDSRVKLSSKKSGSYTLLHVTVKADNDDDARSPKLVVSLPRNCRVGGIIFSKGFERTAYQILGSASQAAPKDHEQIDAHINFDFPNFKVGQQVDIKIQIEPIYEKYRKGSSASAFVYSLTPEFKKENNYVVIPVS